MGLDNFPISLFSDIDENQLTALPDGIGQLSKLDSLEIAGKQLSALPDGIGQLSNLSALDIGHNQLSALPDWIGQLSNLWSLSIGFNQLSALPDRIGQLSNLFSLDMWVNNQLSALPDRIEELSNLSALNITGNQLSTLPDWIGQLSNLTSLSIGGNQISALPDGIGQLSNLSSLSIGFIEFSTLPDGIGQLSNLSSLSIGFNQLSALPDWIGQLSNLSSLNIGGNQLSALPDGIGQLSNLSSLSIGGNQLSALPDGIEQLSNLSSLDIYNNQLSALPDGIEQLSNLSSLNIRNNQLSALPDWIGQLSNLSSLDITGNQLSALPDGIGQLSNLSSLSIGFNQLSALPDWIGQLSNLSSLSIGGNQLSALPDGIGQLSNLSSLNIRNNQLSALPDWIGQLSNLSSLDIRNNQLSALPDGIGQLSNLSSLDIGGNPLSALPDWIGQLSNLSSLDIRNNQLSTLPDWIGQLSNLSSLDISYNKLSALPDWIGQLSNLSSLDIRNNQLSALPDWIGQLSNLSFLRIDENPLIDPPIEIAKQGIEAIRNYFEEKKKVGSEKVYEAKLLIVGEPGAGKTSLQRKLLNVNSPLPEKDESTKGIDIADWPYAYENDEITIHIWDFGGQQILKATHSFFMNRGAVFVLLADSRSDNTDYFDWLYRIETFAGDSPVILVHNEHDDRPKEINMNQLSQRFPEIQSPLRCNLAKVKIEERGNEFSEVVNKIQYEISRLDVMGQELPKSWVSIRNKLVKIADDGKFFISKEKFLSICETSAIDRKKAKFISQYLHDIGAILHFQDDPILEHVVIIQPEWATDAVYQLIEDVKILKNYGRFAFNDLNSIWTKECYQDQYHTLIQLMKNFQLCYEIPSQKGNYILPQLLRYQPQEYSWDGEGNLFIEYVYPDYYLTDIMTRFIVNSHDLIENHDFVWRNGVVLAKDEQRAEIVADENRQRIKVRISGDFKNNLLVTIMDIFRKIHKDYSKMKVELKVPCNCEKCSMTLNPKLFDYEELLAYLKMNITKTWCSNSGELIDIQELIDYYIPNQYKENKNKNDQYDDISYQPPVEFS